MSSTRTIGYLSMAAMLVSLACTIVGIVIWTSSIPTSECGEASISPADQALIDDALRGMAGPLFVGGILGLIGGVIGAFGGFKTNRAAICWQSGLSGVACAVFVIGCLLALLWSAVFSELCDDYKCGDTSSPFPVCHAADVCCKGDDLFATVVCAESNAWACEMKTKKLVAVAISIVATLVVAVASGFGCGACCCCPNKFFVDEEERSGSVVGTVVGKAVESNVVAREV